MRTKTVGSGRREESARGIPNGCTSNAPKHVAYAARRPRRLELLPPLLVKMSTLVGSVWNGERQANAKPIPSLCRKIAGKRAVSAVEGSRTRICETDPFQVHHRFTKLKETARTHPPGGAGRAGVLRLPVEARPGQDA